MTQQIPPDAQMNRLLMNGWLTHAISVVTRLGVPDAIGDGVRSAAEIATDVGADPQLLNRVMRALTEIDVFVARDGGYALTPLGATLRPGTPGSLASMAMVVGSDWQFAALGKLFDSLRTGRSAGPELWDGGLFGYLDRNPDDAAVFNTAMIEISASSTAAVAAGYDFSRFTTLV